MVGHGSLFTERRIRRHGADADRTTLDQKDGGAPSHRGFQRHVSDTARPRGGRRPDRAGREGPTKTHPRGGTVRGRATLAGRGENNSGGGPCGASDKLAGLPARRRPAEVSSADARTTATMAVERTEEGGEQTSPGRIATDRVDPPLVGGSPGRALVYGEDVATHAVRGLDEVPRGGETRHVARTARRGSGEDGPRSPRREGASSDWHRVATGEGTEDGQTRKEINLPRRRRGRGRGRKRRGRRRRASSGRGRSHGRRRRESAPKEGTVRRGGAERRGRRPGVGR